MAGCACASGVTTNSIATPQIALIVAPLFHEQTFLAVQPRSHVDAAAHDPGDAAFKADGPLEGKRIRRDDVEVAPSARADEASKNLAPDVNADIPNNEWEPDRTKRRGRVQIDDLGGCKQETPQAGIRFHAAGKHPDIDAAASFAETVDAGQARWQWRRVELELVPASRQHPSLGLRRIQSDIEAALIGACGSHGNNLDRKLPLDRLVGVATERTDVPIELAI